MTSRSRPAIVDGADLSLPAFLLMPVFAAGLSVAMWLQLPTFQEALEARKGPILERRAVFERLAATVPTEPVVQPGCSATLSPPPRFDEDDDTVTNVAVLGPGELEDMKVVPRLKNDQDLYVHGQVRFLVYWLENPPLRQQRMSRARIAAEIEQPIQNNRYVLFYGTTKLSSGDVRLDAFLYDLASEERVCDLGFTSSGDFTETDSRFTAMLNDAGGFTAPPKE